MPSYLSLTRTSGSTGDRLLCLSDHRIAGLPINHLSEFSFGSDSLEDIRLATLASPICQGHTCDIMDVRTYDQRISGPTKNILNLPIPINLTNIDTNYLQQFHDELFCHRPNILLVDPIYLYLIVKSSLLLDLDLWEPKLIFYSYEFVPKNALDFLKQYFPHTHFRSYYAATELGGARIALECRNGNLHCWPDHTLVEVLDRNNNHCKPDEVGRVVVTNIINDAMPLIRYELGDLGSWSSQKCSCSLSNWPILQFHGRRDHSLLSRETQIPCTLIDSIISQNSSIELYTISSNSTSIFLSYPDTETPLSDSEKFSIEQAFYSFGFSNVSFDQSLKLHPEPSRKFSLFRRLDD